MYLLLVSMPLYADGKTPVWVAPVHMSVPFLDQVITDTGLLEPLAHNNVTSSSALTSGFDGVMTTFCGGTVSDKLEMIMSMTCTNAAVT